MKNWVGALLVSTSMLVPVSARADIFGDFGEPAWSRMWKYFESRLGQTAVDEQILVLPVATNAAWDQPNKTLRLLEMYKWGDWMPSNAWQYAPNANKRVSDGYQYFLNAALIALLDKNGTAPPELVNATKNAIAAVDFARTDYNTMQTDAQNAYSSYLASKPIPRKTKSEFYKDQGYDQLINAKNTALQKQLTIYVAITASIKNPDVDLIQRAQTKFLNPLQKIWLPPIEDVLNDPDRWQQYYITYVDEKGKSLSQFLKEYNPETENITASNQQSDYFEQHWHASVAVGFLGFFGAVASADETKRELHVKNNTTRIDINFANMATFPIARGEWFDEDVISRFAPMLRADAYNAILGRNGLLELIPKELLVARGMSFSIYADSDSLDYLYDHFEAAGGFGLSIGFFGIGGGGNYSSTKEQTQVTKFADHIVFTDLSGRAKVLAVLCKNYSASIAKPKFELLSDTDPRFAAAQKMIESSWVGPTAFKAVTEGMDKMETSNLIRE